MRKLKKGLVLSIIMLCVLMQMCICVRAVPVQRSSNMDVVLVIDVSGSMKKTDPEKIALEGAKLFVDMMENSGSRAGLVAFSHELVQVYNLTAINSGSDKASLKNAIDTLQFSGDTDIGTAVEKAVEMLTSVQDVGNNKMVLFFTDGEIDLPKGSPSETEAENLSKEKSESAIVNAAAANIPIYTIGLNVNGGVDTDLISKMASSTEAKNNIVTAAGELPAIFNDIFADFVETEINELGDITIADANVYEELPFSIPNDSVLEANIVMITSGEGTLTDVQLVKPDGSTISPDGKTTILSTSNNYNMLKLIGPMSGTWTLRIKGDQGCQVHVNLLFNYDVILKSSGQADDEGNLTISATLEKNGTLVADEALYAQLVTTACVTRADGTVTSYPMNLNGNAFSCTVPVSEGETVTVYTHTEGANMYRDSEPFTYVNNTVTTATIIQLAALPSPIKISGLLPSRAKTTIDLAAYFGSSDPTINTNVYTARVEDNSVASVQLNGNKLELKGIAKGNTRIEVQGTDAEGNILYQQADLIVDATFGSIVPLILIMASIVLVIVIVIVIIVNKPKPLSGYLYWQLLSEDGYSVNTNEEQFDLTFARTKAIVSNFVTELSLAYAGLDKVEITAGKNGLVVQNKGKVCVLMDENGAEVKKLNLFDGGGFKIACRTDDGDPLFVSLRYQKDLNDMFY